jgi:hypothetical protein
MGPDCTCGHQGARHKGKPLLRNHANKDFHSKGGLNER